MSYNINVSKLKLTTPHYLKGRGWRVMLKKKKPFEFDKLINLITAIIKLIETIINLLKDLN